MQKKISEREYRWFRRLCAKPEVPEKIKPETPVTYYWKISYRISVILIIVTTLGYFCRNNSRVCDADQDLDQIKTQV